MPSLCISSMFNWAVNAGFSGNWLCWYFVLVGVCENVMVHVVRQVIV